MGSNTFGTHFKMTTWGESHGKAIGVVIDGCPPGIPLTEEDVRKELKLRAPGNSPYTSPRKEMDEAEIYSGLFDGKTTGAPISIVIPNKDADSSKYEPIKDIVRPGHANATYLQKYGVFDYRGGGRASARETACRVAAGAVAKKLLSMWGITVRAYVREIGGVLIREVCWESLEKSALFCPDLEVEGEMKQVIEEARAEGDSVGGVIELYLADVPAGLGDPIYQKIEARLAQGMLSIPASKGFEIGSGFAAAQMRGSVHNDAVYAEKGRVQTRTNHAGGTLGGITNGMPLIARVAFKPTSSIQKTQESVDLDGKKAQFSLPEGSRHDPCVAIRAVPVVEAMGAVVLADCLCSQATFQLVQESRRSCGK